MAVNDYCTLADIQAAFPDVNAGNDFTAGYNSLITSLITRSSRQFDDWTNRKPGAYFVNAITQNLYNGYAAYTFSAGGTGLNYYALRTEEMAAAPTLVEVSMSGKNTDFVAWQAADWFAYPYNALEQGSPYWAIVADFINGSQYYFGFYPRNVRITALFGYSNTVPDMVKQAIILQTARWFKRAQQQYQDLSTMSDPEQQIYAKYDTDFYDAVDRYRKVSVAVR